MYRLFCFPLLTKSQLDRSVGKSVPTNSCRFTAIRSTRQRGTIKPPGRLTNRSAHQRFSAGLFLVALLFQLFIFELIVGGPIID
jgi:hypothetical protein